MKAVNRPGVDNLIDWLENKSDFFTAPASTQYHGAVQGGLLEHSLAVHDALLDIMGTFNIDATPETIVIVSLLHDICKANFYAASTRNVKNEQTGQWEKKPFYKIEDKFPYGHGEKSVFILREFIPLSAEEAMAIRWHMGAWGAESYSDKQALRSAMDKYPLILALQTADQAATFFDKK